MIESGEQAIAVQSRRRRQGLNGRSKAVRRWFKREHGRAVDAHSGLLEVDIEVGGPAPVGRRNLQRKDLKEELRGDFTGCRSYTETYLKGQ